MDMGNRFNVLTKDELANLKGGQWVWDEEILIIICY